MSGIYIHIPFCKQACHYCNFHFSTSMKNKEAMIAAIIHEIELQKDYLKEKKLSTIYFGGGTPSLLSQKELDSIFKKINQIYSLADDAEITLEANPDDLTTEKLKALRDSPINRLSIGVQSFSEKDLRFMNRAHNESEARLCIENAYKFGFDTLTIDLIYGSPTTSDEQWKKNLDITFGFDISHISSYCLTVEEKTALGHFVKTGKAPQVDEEQAARQFEYLMLAMNENGYVHYEISNFAKPTHYAKHNSNYWFGEFYLGIGPAAHSYNKKSRQWNIAHNPKYINAIQNNQVPFELETITPTQRYNEYVMTSLRTIWGCKIDNIDTTFQEHFLTGVQNHVNNKTIVKKENAFILTDKGRLFADRIAMELFVDD